MTTTFDGVTLPNAGKLQGQTQIAIRDALLMDGKHRIRSNTNTAFNPTFRCMGTYAQHTALVAKVGTAGTLITPQNPTGYTQCYIASLSELQESDNPSYFYWTISFKRDTS